MSFRRHKNAYCQPGGKVDVSGGGLLATLHVTIWCGPLQPYIRPFFLPLSCRTFRFEGWLQPGGQRYLSQAFLIAAQALCMRLRGHFGYHTPDSNTALLHRAGAWQAHAGAGQAAATAPARPHRSLSRSAPCSAPGLFRPRRWYGQTRHKPCGRGNRCECRSSGSRAAHRGLP